MADSKCTDEEKEAVTIIDVIKSLVKPLTRDNLRAYYLPVAGAISLSAFSINVLNPEWFIRWFPRSRIAISNSLLFNAHLGTGLYMYFRPHIQMLGSCSNRLIYTSYSTILFNFGSVLLWAVTKAVLPNQSSLRAVFGIASSICLLKTGIEYVDHIDKNMVQDKQNVD